MSKPSFSQRRGINPTKKNIQIESMDDDLRNGIWNSLHKHYWAQYSQYFSHSISQLPELHKFVMNLEEFYDNLRSEDRENVRNVVQALRQNFVIYATGSALQKPDYGDVDLVAKARDGTHVPALKMKLLENTLRGVDGARVVCLPNTDFCYGRYEVNIGDTEFDIMLQDILKFKEGSPSMRV